MTKKELFIPSPHAESPPGEAPGIRGLIACNDRRTLKLIQGIDCLVLGGITLIGKLQITEDLLLTDPSLVQFAAAVNSEKSLKVLLDKSKLQLRSQPPHAPAIITSQSFEQILRPIGTNTKLDVLTLAALVHKEGPNKLGDSKKGKERRTSLEFLLKYIIDNEEDRTNDFQIDFHSYDGHTPLWHACARAQWEAVKKLHAANADFLAEQKSGNCPAIEGLLGPLGVEFAQSVLATIEQKPGVSVLSYICRDVHWGDDLRPTDADHGDRLYRKLDGKVSATLLNILIEAAAVEDKGVFVVPPQVETGRDAEPAPVPKEPVPKVCSLPGCESPESLQRCETCREVFCEEHLDDHDCPGPPD
jgi:hypothetical protein